MLSGELPFQIFPGIFSSIDSYSKQVTAQHFVQHGRVPMWFDGFGELGTPIRIPGWSRFQIIDPETNIRLTGIPDEILRNSKGEIWVGDYKTARLTSNQDLLLPMYAVQLNCYGMIAQGIDMGRVRGLGLLYYEPSTHIPDNECDTLIRRDGFFLQFCPKLKPVKFEPDIIPPLLRRVREICDCSDSPPPRLDCDDCYRLEKLIRTARPSFVFLGEHSFQKRKLPHSKKGA